MLGHALATGLVTLLCVGALACGSREPGPTEAEPEQDLGVVREATEIHREYARGDCAEVLDRTEDEDLEAWSLGEIRHSTLLLRGFCQELVDDEDAARRTYERLVESAPTSYAAHDARERLRVLDLGESEAERQRRLEAALARVGREAARRTPIEREPAPYPPVAKVFGIEGYAIIEFDVTPSGETRDASIVESSPPLVFDGTALRAVREWRFARDPSADPEHPQMIRLRFTIAKPATEQEEQRDARSSRELERRSEQWAD